MTLDHFPLKSIFEDKFQFFHVVGLSPFSTLQSKENPMNINTKLTATYILLRC